MRGSVSYKVSIALIVSLFCCSTRSPAQTVTGSMTGTVVDPDGGVIPGVSVKLVSDTSGVVRVALTNDLSLIHI